MAELHMNSHWDEEIFRDQQMKLVVAETVAKAAEYAKAGAPARAGNSWNKIKRNITADVALDEQGWYGNVIVESNDRVRHAMLQDQGFTDRGGRRHPGRYFLKKALAKVRE